MAAQSNILNRSSYRAVNRRRNKRLAVTYYLPSLYLIPFCNCRLGWCTNMLAEKDRYRTGSVKNLNLVLFCEMLIFRRMNACRES